MQMEKGQMSVDFMIATTVLIFGISLIITQIPMLFAPLLTISTDIHAVAYRTSMILVEDAGIYCENGSITSAWEDPEKNAWNFSQYLRNRRNYLSNVRRIGLAMNAPVWSSHEDTVPNNLSMRKIQALQDWWDDSANRSMLWEKLGLLVSYNGDPVNYSFNISLKSFNNMLIWNHSAGKPLLQIGHPIPTGATVERIERIVAIDDCRNLGMGIGDNECCGILEVCIWK